MPLVVTMIQNEMCTSTIGHEDGDEDYFLLIRLVWIRKGIQPSPALYHELAMLLRGLNAMNLDELCLFAAR